MKNFSSSALIFCSAFLCNILLCGSLSAQEEHNCSDCPCILKHADERLKAKKYTEAINLYNAAKICDPASFQDMNGKIDEAVGLLKLDLKRAEEARDEAIRLKTKANKEQAEKEKALAQLKETSQKIEENNRKLDAVNGAFANSVKALQVARTDPTVGLRMAERASRMFPPEMAATSTIALSELLNDPSKSFYKTELQGHDKLVNSISVSPKGGWVLSASGDKTAILWTTEGKEQLTLWGHHESVNAAAFSPDGTLMLTGSSDQTAKLWDMDGRELATFFGHQSAVSSVAFDRIGQRVITGSNDMTVKIWDLSGKLLRSIRHTSEVNSVAVSPNGQMLLVGCQNSTARIWNLDTGEEGTTFGEHKDEVLAALFLNDDVFVTGSRDGTAKKWAVDRKESLITFTGHKDAVVSIALSPDGAQLLSGSRDGTAILWDINDGIATKTFSGESPIRSVAFMLDAQSVLSAGDDGTIKVWPTVKFAVSQTTPRMDYSTQAAAFSPDNEQVVFYGQDLYEGVHGIETASLNGTPVLKNIAKGDDAWVKVVAFAPDAQTFLTGDEKGSIQRWSTRNAEMKSKEQLHKTAITVLQFPDGNNFGRNTRLISGEQDTIALVWGITPAPDDRLQVLHLLSHSAIVSAAALSPDLKLAAVGGTDGDISLWKLEKAPVKIDVFQNRPFRVNSLAFSPDGKSILAAYNGMARLWEIGKKHFVEFPGHGEAIDRALFSPDGQSVLTVGSDRYIKFWNLDGGELLTFQNARYETRAVAFSPDGRYVRTMDASGSIRSWCAPKVFLAEQVAQIPLSVLQKKGMQMDTSSNKLLEYKDFTLHMERGEQALKAKQWETAHQWFAAAAALSNKPYAHTSLHRVAKLSGQTFDYQTFHSSRRVRDLLRYASHCEKFSVEKCPECPEEAARIYEKAYGLSPTPRTLLNRYEIANRTQQPFDTDQFLNTPRVHDLSIFANYFYEKKSPLAKPLYEKLDTLYSFPQNLIRLHAIALRDSQQFDYGRFLQSEDPDELRYWARELFRNKNKPFVLKTIQNLYVRADGLKHDPDNHLQLYKLLPKQGHPAFEWLFKNPKTAQEAQLYADASYSKEDWNTAYDLYKILENDTAHSIQNLIRLYEVSQKTTPKPEKVDFKRFSQSENVSELLAYAHFFLRLEDRGKAGELYSKAAKIGFGASEWKELNTEAMLGLYETVKETQDSLFASFLKSENVSELRRYSEFFTKFRKTKYNWEKIPWYERAVQIDEKLLRFDTTTYRREIISNHYNSLGWYQLFANDGGAALAALKRGEEINPKNAYLYTNFPLAYLLEGNFTEAKNRYLAFQEKPYGLNGYETYRDVFLADINKLYEAGVKCPHFTEICEMLKGGANCEKYSVGN